MLKEYKYYFKILNDELFGGEGSEGYMSMSVNDKYDNPVEVAKNKFYVTKYSNNVEIIEISKEEYEENIQKELEHER